jgi:hypothetical protein
MAFSIRQKSMMLLRIVGSACWMRVVKHRSEGLDGEILPDAAGRGSSCLAAVAAAE